MKNSSLLLDEIKKITETNYESLVNIRRTIHQYPEKGYEEYKTSALIKEELKKLEVFEIIESAKTGVVAIIKGTKKSNEKEKCIALRADIDGLEVPDNKTVEYSSKVANMSHSCGHDAHTTILLGVAHNLACLRDKFSGTVKLFFQPAEETTGGAEVMIKEGHLENPYVENVYGLHVTGLIPAGCIRFCHGTMQASSDDIIIKIIGTGAHAAHPDHGIDSILVAAKVIDGLQTLISRTISPTDSACITIGKINGGTAPNAICEEILLEGTLRTLDLKIREKLQIKIEQLVKGIASAYGASAEVTIIHGYPCLVNDEKELNEIMDIASEIYNDNNLIVENTPSLGVEDFAYFTLNRPSCFYNIGVANQEKGIVANVHNPNFDIDEKSLYFGVITQTLITMKKMGE